MPSKLFVIFIAIIFSYIIFSNVNAQETSLKDSTTSSLTDTTSTDTTKIDTVKFEVVEYSADSIEWYANKNMIVLYSNGDVRYKSMRLQADTIQFNYKTRWVLAKGAPVLWDKQDKIIGDSMAYNLDTRKGIIYKGETVFENGYYDGKEIRQLKDKSIAVKEANFTTCELTEPHYHFTSSKMKIYMKDKVVAKPVVMYVEDVPVMIAPFYIFPIRRDRHSGFLVPSVGYHSLKARTVKNLGYYWAINNYTDATASLNYWGDVQNWQGTGEYRYLWLYRLNGTINGSYYSQNTPEKQTQYRIDAIHNQILGETSTLRGEGHFQSSKFYRETSENIEDRLTRDVRSYLTLSRKWRNANLNVSIDDQRNLETKVRTDLLPNINFTYKNYSTNFLIKDYYDPQTGASDKILPQFSYNLPQKAIIQTKSEKATKQKIENGTHKAEEKEVFYEYYEDFYIANPDTIETDSTENDSTDSQSTIHDSQSEIAKVHWYNMIYYNYNGSILNNYRINSAGQNEINNQNWNHNIGLSSPQKFLGWLVINLGTTFTEKWYKNNDLTTGKKYERIGTTSGLTIGANTTIYGTIYPNVYLFQGFRHIITPSISYNYKPNKMIKGWDFKVDKEDPNLGADFNNSINLSMNQQLLMKWGHEKDKAKKINLGTLGNSTSYNFLAKSRGERPWGNLSSSLRIDPSSILSSNINTNHNIHEKRMENVSVSTTLNWNNNTLSSILPKHSPNITKTDTISVSDSTQNVGSTGERGARKNADTNSLQKGVEDTIPTPTQSDSLYLRTARKRSKETRIRALADTSKMPRTTTITEERLPWSISLTHQYTKSFLQTPQQEIRSNINLHLTKNWRVNYSIYYNITIKELVSQSASIIRDLHCWELSLVWQSTKVEWSYDFKMNAKAIPDLKIDPLTRRFRK